VRPVTPAVHSIPSRNPYGRLPLSDDMRREPVLERRPHTSRAARRTPMRHRMHRHVQHHLLEARSMRSHLLLALGVAALPALAVPAFAAPLSPLDTLASTRARPRPAPPLDTARVAALMERADEASFSGRVGEARRLYREIIDAHREANQSAGIVLWRMATTNLYANDTRGAASALDEMAEMSARYGDPVNELRATFEAAVLYAQLKRGDLVATRMERVDALLQSPVIPESEKEQVRSRIKGG
jgi:hypothetical protein